LTDEKPAAFAGYDFIKSCEEKVTCKLLVSRGTGFYKSQRRYNHVDEPSYISESVCGLGYGPGCA
jgi:hypothetical protein